VGDFIYTKGKTICDFGRTWKVEKITPKQVHVVAEDFWFPVFKKTAYGRVANGEDKKRMKHMKEWFECQKGELRTKFWKTGIQVGDNCVTNLLMVKS